jgi:hypothetical protein
MTSAYTRFRPPGLGVSVRANKVIEAGDEITISCKIVYHRIVYAYISNRINHADIDIGSVFEERQTALSRWGFKCQCNLCSAPEVKRDASDERRKSIKTKQEEIQAAYKNGDAPRAIMLTNDIIENMEIEEMYSLIAEQYENLARIYWAVNDKKKAKILAQKSIDYLLEQGYLEPRPDYLWRMLQTFE